MATIDSLAGTDSISDCLDSVYDDLVELNAEVQALTAGNVAWTYVDKTASYTIVASTDTYGTKVFTNDGATATITLSLPAGATAMRVSFNVVDAYTLKISANGTETIRHKATQTAGGGYLQSATAGDFITLEWNGDEWIVVTIQGHNWTDGTATLNIATATLRGEVELATDAEAITGTDTSRAITAANLDAVLDDRTFNKNAIINGDFNIWQRGTSFAAITTSVYNADRFRYDKVGVMVHTVSRDTDVPTQSESGHKSNYSLKVDCTTIDAAIAAGDFIAISQMVEGYNFAPFVGKTATISFWVKATKPGIYCISFRNTPVADRSYVSEYTINVANTWEKKTVTLIFNYTGGTWDYTNGIGIEVTWTLAFGTTFQTTAGTWQNGDFHGTANQVNGVDSTDNNFWLAQVQFELGSVATDFEYRQFGDELARCQRYYEKSYDYDVAPATSDEDGAVHYTDPVAAGDSFVNFKVVKRAASTMVGYSSTGASAKYRDLTSGADFNITISDVGFSGFHATFATSGAADELKAFHWTAAAEL